MGVSADMEHVYVMSTSCLRHVYVCTCLRINSHICTRIRCVRYRINHLMTVLEYVFPPTYLEVKDRERLPRALVEAVAEAEKIAVGFNLIALGEAGGVEGRCGEFAVLQSDRGGRG